MSIEANIDTPDQLRAKLNCTARQSHAPAHDTIAKAAAEAAILANSAPAHAREFWRRLAGSLRKAATIPR